MSTNPKNDPPERSALRRAVFQAAGISQESSSSPSERSAETRARILDAALREFASHGLAGARTERIAEAAGVNKALLYYYFESKEKLYIAALETIAERIRDSNLAVFLREASPGERILRVALNHFDRIWSMPEFQSLMQQEMMRLREGETGHIGIIAKKAFDPILVMYQSMAREGVASGELIEADWMQILFASLGANVFYFLSAHIWRIVIDIDLLTVDAIAARRKALLEFLGQAIFRDRQHGAELAARVFADTPMPPAEGDRINFGRDL
jgi:TetR/AcrR family transcriptional regulator